MIISRRMRRTGHLTQMGRRGTLIGYWWENQRGKRPPGRPRRRWLDNIGMDLGEVGWSDVDWIGLAQDGNKWRALVYAVKNLQVP
jgi:hypothetical protein